jgi:hypothetical protein
MMTAFTAVATVLFLLEAGNAAHQWVNGTLGGGTFGIYLALGAFGLYSLIVGK